MPSVTYIHIIKAVSNNKKLVYILSNMSEVLGTVWTRGYTSIDIYIYIWVTIYHQVLAILLLMEIVMIGTVVWVDDENATTLKTGPRSRVSLMNTFGAPSFMISVRLPRKKWEDFPTTVTLKLLIMDTADDTGACMMRHRSKIIYKTTSTMSALY